MTAVPIYSWYDLSLKEQREVLRLARRGRRHSDVKVAKVAEEWAKEKLGKDHGKSGALGEAILGGLFGDGASLGEGIRDYRRAKRIMRVVRRP
jgi:hypothetical protein